MTRLATPTMTAGTVSSVPTIRSEGGGAWLPLILFGEGVGGKVNKGSSEGDGVGNYERERAYNVRNDCLIHTCQFALHILSCQELQTDSPDL